DHNLATQWTRGGSGFGGGIYVAGGIVEVSNCAFSFNRADSIGSGTNLSMAQGGGIYEAGGSISLTNCTFQGNLADGVGIPVLSQGNAIYVGGGSLTIQNGSIDNDLYIAAGSVCINKNTTFAGVRVFAGDPEVFGPFTIC